MNYLRNKQITAETLFPDLNGICKSSKEYNSENFYFRKALITLEENDFKKTEENFQKIIKPNPNIINIYVKSGIVFYKQGKYDKTVENYRQAIGLDHINIYAYNKSRGYFG